MLLGISSAIMSSRTVTASRVFRPSDTCKIKDEKETVNSYFLKRLEETKY
jgi:hypothetical protein